ncbi:HAD family phosphatase [Acetobacter sp. AN02]|uniref:HAD family hydrolase n=1 Tax=Acetobacter sp. AN02 TaxID=2894186 RepID=UPI0024343593|nr:HAD family phosphatase [Acetobacter sp. AN02]MDG6094266.1 HAD family phosphatase [Acetobacter sp. AN02]
MTRHTALDPEGSLGLVIFDCDGVLVDSEVVSCRILATEARRLGLDLPDELAVEMLAGKALTRVQEEFEDRTGKMLGAEWVQQMQDAFVASFDIGVPVIPGAPQMLDDVLALNLPVRVGSNSSHAEMASKFRVTGLGTRFGEGRIHSGREMKAPKPAPDVYLYAAQLENVRPENCVVLEDSDSGARAALDADMTCVLFRPLSAPVPEWMTQAGKRLIRIEKLSEFPVILRNALISQGRIKP